jgi:hypothetical protein
MLVLVFLRLAGSVMFVHTGAHALMCLLSCFSLLDQDPSLLLGLSPVQSHSFLVSAFSGAARVSVVDGTSWFLLPEKMTYLCCVVKREGAIDPILS